MPISLSTLADQVGGCTAALTPLFKRLEAHVLSAERLHGDDTTLPVLAKGKTLDTGRIWVYVRDDKPFGGPAPPAAAILLLSRSNWRGSPGALGLLPRNLPGRRLERLWHSLRAGPYGWPDLGSGLLGPRPTPVLLHGRSGGERASQSPGQEAGTNIPLALEAVRRIDALFEIERAINGQNADRRKAVRQELSAPLVADLETWMREQRAKLSRGNDVAKAMDYMLKRWAAFTRFLEDGRICLSNNAAERGVRGIALGRKSWLFCGSDRGGQRAALMYSLIVTAKMNDIDPQAWLADVLARIAEHPVQKLDELLPWNWRPLNAQACQAA